MSGANPELARVRPAAAIVRDVVVEAEAVLRELQLQRPGE
jgi:hypothetical protein